MKNTSSNHTLSDFYSHILTLKSLSFIHTIHIVIHRCVNPWGWIPFNLHRLLWETPLWNRGAACRIIPTTSGHSKGQAPRSSWNLVESSGVSPKIRENSLYRKNLLLCAVRENRTPISTLARSCSTTKPWPQCDYSTSPVKKFNRSVRRNRLPQVHPSGLEPELTVPKTVVISVSL